MKHKTFKLNGETIKVDITEEEDINVKKHSDLYYYSGYIMPNLFGGFPVNLCYKENKIPSINLTCELSYEFTNIISGYHKEIPGKYAMAIFGLYLMDKRENHNQAYFDFKNMIRIENSDLYMNFVD